MKNLMGETILIYRQMTGAAFDSTIEIQQLEHHLAANKERILFSHSGWDIDPFGMAWLGRGQPYMRPQKLTLASS